MFTGLIEAQGITKNFKRSGSFYELTIESDISNNLILGQSVSVSGACLTVTGISGKNFTVELMAETVNKTWFGKNLHPGIKLNLERALKLNDRLDGHIVSGHVDGIAVLKELRGSETKQALFCPDDKNLLYGIVSKGSIAIDGVSLTVIDVNDDKNYFSVGLIPTTLKFCTLGNIRVGSIVNIETDILGKYVARALQKNNSNNIKITMEELKNFGY